MFRQAELTSGQRQLHTATLVQYTENGITSMAKTVGLTAAIATQVCTEGGGDVSVFAAVGMRCCAHLRSAIDGSAACLLCVVVANSQLILDGKTTERGVISPMSPEWYVPILSTLHDEGVNFVETVKDL